MLQFTNAILIIQKSLHLHWEIEDNIVYIACSFKCHLARVVFPIMVVMHINLVIYKSSLKRIILYEFAVTS